MITLVGNQTGLHSKLAWIVWSEEKTQPQSDLIVFGMVYKLQIKTEQLKRIGANFFQKLKPADFQKLKPVCVQKYTDDEHYLHQTKY